VGVAVALTSGGTTAAAAFAMLMPPGTWNMEVPLTYSTPSPTTSPYTVMFESASMLACELGKPATLLVALMMSHVFITVSYMAILLALAPVVVAKLLNCPPTSTRPDGASVHNAYTFGAVPGAPMFTMEVSQPVPFQAARPVAGG
jgi:hypothetical protein